MSIQEHLVCRVFKRRKQTHSVDQSLFTVCVLPFKYVTYLNLDLKPFFGK